MRVSMLVALVASAWSLGCETASGGSGGDAESTTTTGVATGATSGATKAASTTATTSTSQVAASTSTSTSSYDPCPLDMPCRFMPLGDSITEGYEGGYRVPLFRKVLAANKQITFVGSRENGPAEVDGVPFPRAHEGHSGYYIDANHSSANIADLVNASIAEHAPHVIALMIGANDVSRSHLEDSPALLANLVDQILAAAPDALLVLAQITPTQTPEDDVFVEAYNATMPELVSSRAAAGKHIVLVDMYGAFKADPNYATTLLLDNLHPNSDGDVVMAGVWFDAVESLLH